MRVLLLLGLLVGPACASAADYPEPTQGDYVVRDFKFKSGDVLPELRIHYRTLGKPTRGPNGEVDNAVLVLHGTTGSGANFIRPEFAGELFGKGQLLDAGRHFVILPDGIGHGGSSKPSDGLRARFPTYGYSDMIDAQFRLLREGLNVDHLRLVIGTSMGGMHTWLWGEQHPEFMDALMPLASLPSQISGRNRVWRRVIIDAIRHDPAWQGGDYRVQPPSLRTAAEMLFFMGSNPVVRQKEAPSRDKADLALNTSVDSALRTLDANDVLYALESSSDYNPAPALDLIRAPLVAINFEDDLINPPELGILEREIRLVKRGKAILMPRTDATRGHGTHTLAAIWKDHLAKLLSETAATAERAAVDFSGYRAQHGVDVRQNGEVLEASWPINDKENAQLRIDLRAGRPLIDSIAIAPKGVITWTPIAINLSPDILLTVGARRASDGRPTAMSPFNEFFDSPASRSSSLHSASIDRLHVRVSNSGRRTTITFDGLTIGAFSGEFQVSIYAGSPLLHMETVARTKEPNRAFLYDMGLLMDDEAPGRTFVWIDTEGALRSTPTQDKGSDDAKVRHRTIALETANGSIACFPPPHQFFFPRDYTDNLGYVWARRHGFGIRQSETGGGSYSPWFNAPPETDQRLGMFLLISNGKAKDAINAVLKYTNGDRFADLPGHVTFTSHWHMAIAMAAQAEIAKNAGRTTPDFVRMFKEMGVKIVHLAEFHGDGHPQDPGPVRLAEMRSMFDECRRLSDGDLLLLPGEEANVHLGKGPGKNPGHWLYLFPRPVYWTMKRASGQPFVEQDAGLGTVYHVGDQEDMFRLLKEERGLAWTAHARIKASSWAPDVYRDEDFFRSDVWLGAAWKAMPADLSRPRLGERGLDLLDDLSQWGFKKHLLGEVDVFKLDHTHELYGHMNVNYLRLDRAPRFGESWEPVLDALRNGRFFVSTGEVLISDFQVGIARSGETVSTKVETRPEIRIELRGTFPLSFAEVVTGDGQRVDHERIDLSDAETFGRVVLTRRPDLKGKKWVRIEAWDVAANGAFSQPVWLEP
jgi:homoserine acetyltransferase